MAEFIQAKLIENRRNLAKAEANTSEDVFACPYCEERSFSRDERLWDHVQSDHPQQLKYLGVHPQTPAKLYRKLLREEAAHKAKGLTGQRPEGNGKGPRKAAQIVLPDDPAASDLQMNLLSLDGSADVTTALEPTRKASSPRKRLNHPADLVHRSKEAKRNTKSGPGSQEARTQLLGNQDQRPKQQAKTLYNPQSPDTFEKSFDTAKARVSSPTFRGLLGLRRTDSRPTSRSPEHFKTSNPSSPITEDVHPPAEPRERGILEVSAEDRNPKLLLQPDSRPISQSQLAAEVKSIYAGLVMVENKCISVDKAQAAAVQEINKSQLPPLADDHWQALIALHRTLLHEHHDFFLASQHPSATPALQRLALKYSMPARMWKHAIHSFLELLRKRLPESLDYMLSFIYLAYQMVALLYETVPAFEETWIECLGDLGRYRMAIEDEDLRDRETWAGVARFWYSKAADKSPAVGRLYHHLAILARPNALQQLFFYARSLACIQPFMSARESILTLLDPVLGRTRTTYSHAGEVDTAFIKAHGQIFTKELLEKSQPSIDGYIRQLDGHIGRVTAKWRDQGVFVAVTNISSLFGYAEEGAVLRIYFDIKFKKDIEAITRPHGVSNDNIPTSSTPPPEEDPAAVLARQLSLIDQPTFAYALRITFATFNVVLQRVGDRNVLPHIHCLLIFLVSLSSIDYDCSVILEQVPWESLAGFLNTLAKAENVESPVERLDFPHQTDGDKRPLPEDYLIRGQIWSLDYFPVHWFQSAVDEEERHLELASTNKSRIERILWLGMRLTSENGGLQFDRDLNAWTTNGVVSSKPHNPSGEPMDVDSNLSSNESLNIIAEPTTTTSETSSPPAHTDLYDPIHESIEKGAYFSHLTPSTKKVIVRNYTIIVCETEMLLYQTDVFVMLLENGDWHVLIPKDVIDELRNIGEGGRRSVQAKQALTSINTALSQGKNLSIVDSHGKALPDPAKIVADQGHLPVTAEDKNMDEIIISITRQVSDLTLHEQGDGQIVSGAKPAVLVAEKRQTRLKARREGLTSVASSMIRRLLSSQVKRPG